MMISISLPPGFGNGLAYLLRDFHGNDIVAVHILVVKPAVGRSHKILIFDVNEPFGPSNGLRIGPHNGIVHRPAFFGGE